MACQLCDDSCAGVELEGLLTPELGWLWAQLAGAADRRGDPSLSTGRTTVTAPDDEAGRAAAAWLLDRRHLARGRRVSVDLAGLAAHTAPATPGAVAAHAVGRRLAGRAAARAARLRSETELRGRLAALVPEAAAEGAWVALRRAGWVTRILADVGGLLDAAAAVIRVLPAAGSPPVDRRRLAADATGDPHALDRNNPISGLTLAVLTACGRTVPGASARDAWASVGVVYDDITGGLTMVGVAPDGWTVPPGVPVTVPPRALVECRWPPGAGVAVYVTENPSVLSAASELPGDRVRVVCTSGTPSRIEVDALARLATAGWELHVRADFDDAGINHLNAILTAAPAARPWRMGAADYLLGLEAGGAAVALRVDRLAATTWDSELRNVMMARGVAVYEESLIDKLLADVQ